MEIQANVLLWVFVKLHVRQIDNLVIVGQSVVREVVLAQNVAFLLVENVLLVVIVVDIH